MSAHLHRNARSFRKYPRFYPGIGALKGLFFVIGALLTLAFLFHAQITVRDLEANQRELARALGVYFITRSTSDDVTDDHELGLLIDQIQRTEMPIVVTDETGAPTLWRGIGIPWVPDDPEIVDRVRPLVARMDAETEPVRLQVPGLDMLLHYQYSPAVRRMRWLPFVEIGLGGLFVFLSLFIYRNIKHLEQRRIWVGMARETAHQLGTPLSAMKGWLELIKAQLVRNGRAGEEERGQVDYILGEMDGDLNRLNKIASRFSQIGSVPELTRQDIRAILDDCVAYFNRRTPTRTNSVSIRTAYETAESLEVDVNRELLEWVVENLIRNALDAMDAEDGLIRVSARFDEDEGAVSVRVQDNGKGIRPGVRKRIFEPGVSTKTRGWGLGLSLSRRIIEEYHGGRLTLRESRAGKGTTFEFTLPVPG